MAERQRWVAAVNWTAALLMAAVFLVAGYGRLPTRLGSQ
jgi:hypothetical protein